MKTATVTMMALAAVLLAYAWRRGDGSHRRGIVQGAQTLRRTLPLLLVAVSIGRNDLNLLNGVPW